MPGIEATMHEFKHGELHSGSKSGPKVTNRKQAIAIALNEARKSGKSKKPVKKAMPTDEPAKMMQDSRACYARAMSSVKKKRT